MEKISTKDKLLPDLIWARIVQDYEGKMYDKEYVIATKDGIQALNEKLGQTILEEVNFTKHEILIKTGFVLGGHFEIHTEFQTEQVPGFGKRPKISST